jgi:hypothetical protein
MFVIDPTFSIPYPGRLAFLEGIVCGTSHSKGVPPLLLFAIYKYPTPLE